MNNRMRGLLLVLFTFSVTALCPSAYARSSVFSTPRGQVSHSVERAPGEMSSQWTNARGQTAGRDVSRTGEGVNATAYGPNGRSIARTSMRSKGDVETSVSGSGGKVVTRTVNRDASETSAVITGPNGQVYSRKTQH